LEGIIARDSRTRGAESSKDDHETSNESGKETQYGDVDFAGETFAPGVPTDGVYDFSSYRFTYRYRFADRWELAFGYRTIEGGADVEQVYNFAWLHFGVGSLRVAF